jgi:hypothetical protein
LAGTAYFVVPPLLLPDAGGVAGVAGVDDEDESAGGAAEGAAGAAGAVDELLESEGAGVEGDADGEAGELAGGVAAGVAGASSRLLQPARTAVKTAAARMVWRINMFYLQRLLIGLAEIHGLPKFDYFCS